MCKFILTTDTAGVETIINVKNIITITPHEEQKELMSEVLITNGLLEVRGSLWEFYSALNNGDTIVDCRPNEEVQS